MPSNVFRDLLLGRRVGCFWQPPPKESQFVGTDLRMALASRRVRGPQYRCPMSVNAANEDRISLGVV